MQIGVVGLGKLGLPLALCLAEVGYEVAGFDKNLDLITTLNEGTFQTHEPFVMGLLRVTSVKENFKFSSSSKTLRQCGIIYIIVPTPSNSDGLFDSTFVESAIKEILRVWNGIKEERSIVVVSTVMPGTCSVISRDIIKDRNIKLIYSPEFIALGTVVENLKRPDAMLVGCAQEADAKTHVSVQKRIVGDIPCSILSWEESEVVKLLVNCYVTMKISFANFIGEICDCLPGANPKKIAKALGMDSRIGRKYLDPGLGYAGPCFPRDNAALSAWSLERGLKADLALATQSINYRQPKVTLQRLNSLLTEESSVLIIGLVYKPRTEVLEHSQSLELAQELKSRGHHVSIFDPFISSVDKSQLASNFKFLPNLSKTLSFELVVISHGFEAYAKELGSSQRIYRFS